MQKLAEPTACWVDSLVQRCVVVVVVAWWSLSTACAHQCQCILSPMESQWSCTESGQTGKTKSWANIILQVTLWFCIITNSPHFESVVLNMCVTLAWLPDSNSASCCMSIRRQESRETPIAHSVSTVNLPISLLSRVSIIISNNY